METKLILYHGSNQNFDVVDLSKSKDRRDFGRGFYITILREQAEDWAEALFDRYKGDGIYIYETELELSGDLSMKIYEGLSEEWLQMVQKNRTFKRIDNLYWAESAEFIADEYYRGIDNAPR
jgi:hypothetical protein